LDQSSCGGIVGLFFIQTETYFFVPFIKLIGDSQQLNIVYDAVLLADAEKAADRTTLAQIIATRFSYPSTRISEINKVDNSDSFEEFSQSIKRKPSKPSVKF
jgi:hypothetical protein